MRRGLMRVLAVGLALVSVLLSGCTGDAPGDGASPSTPGAAPSSDGETGLARDGSGILPQDPLTACQVQGMPVVDRAVTTTEEYLEAEGEEATRLRRLAIGHTNAVALAFNRCAEGLEAEQDDDTDLRRAAASARRLAESAGTLRRAIESDGDVAGTLDDLTRALDAWNGVVGRTGTPGPAPTADKTSRS